MSDIICVTNRKLCTDHFLERIKAIASAHPHAIILREKDLDLQAYEALAQQVQKICFAQNVPLILNGTPELARRMHCGVQLPFAKQNVSLQGLASLGVSIHTVQEAAALAAPAATYLIAGHIWDTACKAGTPGRGLDFLQAVVQEAQGKPVYAIGGITPERMCTVRAAGAAGACVMSTLMTCANPAELLKSF